ncbi:hypothetical protein HMPREF9140_00618 [Prevotella micans F0438]|uniref:FeoB-associated Cys-rich membrane protein n=1 Tax=Prevotella micans F0438 TaxID=883158 RepID=H1Q130_9BACT|nr:FeoB-associated Cys-rich membrane protein [Prevotella micans]EHO72858.1 hypothetical protein HMPREF9140_00618 [Prevotella micans F0438]MBF1436212.1 FeoB-associated Cys-rich membrane protein [Prevotella micans]
MWQYIFIGVVLLMAMIYVIRRLRQTFTNNNPCHGCTGCSMRKELLKNQHRTGMMKPACHHKI